MFCALFGFSNQAYYKQIKQKQQRAELSDQAVTLVLQLRRAMPRIDTRKLHHLLNQDRVKIGRDKLFGLLRDRHLLVSKKRKYTITTNSKHWMRKYPNLIKEVLPNQPEQIWVADITYINSRKNGHLYFHLITDTYSKQIMGYELCDNMETCSTLRALKIV